jgi:hypothetical protein
MLTTYLFLFLSDELIRQITINCAERGLLLLRVRDEARMTISAYETLYESSIAYGVRKALVAEQKKIDCSAKVSYWCVLVAIDLCSMHAAALCSHDVLFAGIACTVCMFVRGCSMYVQQEAYSRLHLLMMSE